MLVICPEFYFRFLHSGLKDYLSKYKERWCVAVCIKSYFNQINTFQNIGITWNGIISSNVYVVLNRNFHSNVNVLSRLYKHFLTSLYRSTFFFRSFWNQTWNKNICKLNKGNPIYFPNLSVQRSVLQYKSMLEKNSM